MRSSARSIPTTMRLLLLLGLALLALGAGRNEDKGLPLVGLPKCDQCDAGIECGLCLRLVEQEQCPWAIDFTLLSCRARDTFIPGNRCEGSGECGTNDQANNCPAWRDVYVRVNCAGGLLAPSMPPPSPARPPASPPSLPPPHPPPSSPPPPPLPPHYPPMPPSPSPPPPTQPPPLLPSPPEPPPSPPAPPRSPPPPPAPQLPSARGDPVLQQLGVADGNGDVSIPWWAVIVLLAGAAVACLLLCLISAVRSKCCAGERTKASMPVIDPDPMDRPC